MSLKLGTVYRITCDVADVVYIGSTMRSLRRRLQEHRSDSKAWAAGKSRTYCSIFPHMIEHGAEHFKIEPVKQYRVVDARHLRVYATLCIKRAHGACNHNEAFQIKRLWNRRNYRANRERICEQQRNRYQQHRDQILEQQRNHYQRHRERILEYQRNHYQQHRDRIIARHECECGGRFTHQNRTNHIRTKKHQRWAAEQ